MGILRIAAVGALSYFGYKAWRKHQADNAPAPAPALLEDNAARTAPHGDPLSANVGGDATAVPRAGAQSSQGFGAA